MGSVNVASNSKQINYFSLTATVRPREFEVSQGDDVLETIEIPRNLRKAYKDSSHRDLVILDYLDRQLENSEIIKDSDFLKKFAVSINRQIGGILSLDLLKDDQLKLSGINVCVVESGGRKHLKVSAGKVDRLLPYDVPMCVKLLSPIFMVAALRRNSKDECCGGPRKKR